MFAVSRGKQKKTMGNIRTVASPLITHCAKRQQWTSFWSPEKATKITRKWLVYGCRFQT